jgi:hypothetical protein
VKLKVFALEEKSFGNQYGKRQDESDEGWDPADDFILCTVHQCAENNKDGRKKYSVLSFIKDNEYFVKKGFKERDGLRDTVIAVSEKPEKIKRDSKSKCDL